MFSFSLTALILEGMHVKQNKSNFCVMSNPVDYRYEFSDESVRLHSKQELNFSFEYFIRILFLSSKCKYLGNVSFIIV